MEKTEKQKILFLCTGNPPKPGSNWDLAFLLLYSLLISS